MIVAAHGGMEIEDLAENDPNSLRRMTIDPAVGLSEFQAREPAFQLGLKGGQIAQLINILRANHGTGSVTARGSRTDKGWPPQQAAIFADKMPCNTLPMKHCQPITDTAT